jgi:hypothetical protein
MATPWQSIIRDREEERRRAQLEGRDPDYSGIVSKTPTVLGKALSTSKPTSIHTPMSEHQRSILETEASPEARLVNLGRGQLEGQFMQEPGDPQKLVKVDRDKAYDPSTYPHYLGKLPSYNFDVDHIVSVWAGGTDTPDNKRVYTKSQHAQKTKVDNVLYRLYTSGKVDLPEARSMLLNWERFDVKDVPDGFIDDPSIAEKAWDKWQQDMRKAPEPSFWEVAKRFGYGLPVVSEIFGKVFAKDPDERREAQYEMGLALSEAVSDTPQGEFWKGMIGGMSLGHVPAMPESYELEGSTRERLTASSSRAVGGAVGFLVTFRATNGVLGKAMPMIPLGTSATTGTNVFQRASQTWIGLSNRIITPSTVQTGRILPWIRPTIGRFMQQFPSFALLGQMSQQERDDLDARMSRTLSDALWTLPTAGVGPTLGASKVGVPAARLAADSAVGVGTMGTVLAEGGTWEEAIQQGLILGSMHHIFNAKADPRYVGLVKQTEQQLVTRTIEAFKGWGVDINIKPGADRSKYIDKKMDQALKNIDDDAKLSPEAKEREKESATVLARFLGYSSMPVAQRKLQSDIDLSTVVQRLTKMNPNKFTDKSDEQIAQTMAEDDVDIAVGVTDSTSGTKKTTTPEKVAPEKPTTPKKIAPEKTTTPEKADVDRNVEMFPHEEAQLVGEMMATATADPKKYATQNEAARMEGMGTTSNKLTIVRKVNADGEAEFPIYFNSPETGNPYLVGYVPTAERISRPFPKTLEPLVGRVTAGKGELLKMMDENAVNASRAELSRLRDIVNEYPSETVILEKLLDTYSSTSIKRSLAEKNQSSVNEGISVDNLDKYMLRNDLQVIEAKVVTAGKSKQGKDFLRFSLDGSSLAGDRVVLLNNAYRNRHKNIKDSSVARVSKSINAVSKKAKSRLTLGQATLRDFPELNNSEGGRLFLENIENVAYAISKGDAEMLKNYMNLAWGIKISKNQSESMVLEGNPTVGDFIDLLGAMRKNGNFGQHADAEGNSFAERIYSEVFSSEAKDVRNALGEEGMRIVRGQKLNQRWVRTGRPRPPRPTRTEAEVMARDNRAKAKAKAKAETPEAKAETETETPEAKAKAKTPKTKSIAKVKAETPEAKAETEVETPEARKKFNEDKFRKDYPGLYSLVSKLRDRLKDGDVVGAEIQLGYLKSVLNDKKIINSSVTNVLNYVEKLVKEARVNYNIVSTVRLNSEQVKGTTPERVVLDYTASLDMENKLFMEYSEILAKAIDDTKLSSPSGSEDIDTAISNTASVANSIIGSLRSELKGTEEIKKLIKPHRLKALENELRKVASNMIHRRVTESMMDMPFEKKHEMHIDRALDIVEDSQPHSSSAKDSLTSSPVGLSIKQLIKDRLKWQAVIRHAPKDSPQYVHADVMLKTMNHIFGPDWSTERVILDHVASIDMENKLFMEYSEILAEAIDDARLSLPGREDAGTVISNTASVANSIIGSLRSELKDTKEIKKLIKPHRLKALENELRKAASNMIRRRVAEATDTFSIDKNDEMYINRALGIEDSQPYSSSAKDSLTSSPVGLGVKQLIKDRLKWQAVTRHAPKDSLQYVHADVMLRMMNHVFGPDWSTNRQLGYMTSTASHLYRPKNKIGREWFDYVSRSSGVSPAQPRATTEAYGRKFSLVSNKGQQEATKAEVSKLTEKELEREKGTSGFEERAPTGTTRADIDTLESDAMAEGFGFTSANRADRVYDLSYFDLMRPKALGKEAGGKEMTARDVAEDTANTVINLMVNYNRVSEAKNITNSPDKPKIKKLSYKKGVIREILEKYPIEDSSSIDDIVRRIDQVAEGFDAESSAKAESDGDANLELVKKVATDVAETVTPKKPLLTTEETVAILKRNIRNIERLMFSEKTSTEDLMDLHQMLGEQRKTLKEMERQLETETAPKVDEPQERVTPTVGKVTMDEKVVSRVIFNMAKASREAAKHSELLDTLMQKSTETEDQKKGEVRVISSGRTRADAGGLEGARRAGVKTGGYKLSSAFGLKGHSTKKYKFRTEANVVASDGTVIFGNFSSPGSYQTLNFAKKHQKPFIVNPTAVELRKFMEDNGIRVLNVDGNKGRQKVGIRESVAIIVEDALKPKPTEREVMVISGGQTGADVGGLEGARRAGVKTGGYAPSGYKTEKGTNLELSSTFGLKEHPAENYKFRTEANVVASDGTVIFGNASSPGSYQTLNFAKKHQKPFIVNPTAVELRKFMEDNGIRVLNVAGNRESKNVGIQESVARIVEDALKPKPTKDTVAQQIDDRVGDALETPEK